MGGQDMRPKVIESQVVPGCPFVASIDEFIQHVFEEGAPTKDSGRPIGLTLGVEKFKEYGGKHYSLIWIGNGQAALAAEDETAYPTKTRAVAAGVELATDLGVEFDRRSR